MNHDGMNTSIVRLFLWSGIMLIVAMLVAMIPLMHFLPPPSPSLSPEEITQRFVEHNTGIRFGSVIMCIFWSFWATWAIAITMFIRKMEGSSPILTYVSIALAGGGYVFFILIPMTWAVIAFRPESLDPSVIQIMNDWVWFDFLFTWPPFALWMLVVAVAIFNDRNEPRIYPRWIAYFNVWCAILVFPAGLIAFFKEGPFAYDGIFSFWLPFLVFFGWMALMTYNTFLAAAREDRHASEAEPESDAEAPAKTDPPATSI